MTFGDLFGEKKFLFEFIQWAPLSLFGKSIFPYMETMVRASSSFYISSATYAKHQTTSPMTSLTQHKGANYTRLTFLDFSNQTVKYEINQTSSLY